MLTLDGSPLTGANVILVRVRNPEGPDHFFTIVINRWHDNVNTMFGEEKGKIRSTPTPLEILRTVNVLVAPSPLIWITSPRKDWIRSLLPSIIL